jgi:hypothetical protein
MADDGAARQESGAAVVSNRTVEIAVAAIVLLFGATFLYSSYRLGFRWSADGPQSGFFPFYVSLFICGASIAVLIHAFFGKNPSAGDAFVDTVQLKQVLWVLIPSAVYVLGIQAIGIYVASAIYITLFMRLLGKYSWVKSVALGVAISVIFFAMFEMWFRVPLFKGYWNPTAWTGF